MNAPADTFAPDIGDTIIYDAIQIGIGGGRIRTHGALPSTAVFKSGALPLPKPAKCYQINQLDWVSGQVGLPMITRSYHLNRKQNGNIVSGDQGLFPGKAGWPDRWVMSSSPTRKTSNLAARAVTLRNAR